MKLFQNAMSPPCRRVLAVLHHLNMPVELQSVDFQSGEMEKPDYKKMNPNGSVPLLQDGDFHLWESTAIMQYLCEKKGNTELYPNDAKSRADIARWMAWSNCHFGPAAGTIVWENFVKPMFTKEATDADEVKTATVDFHKYAKVMNSCLEGKPFLTGKTVSIADYALAANLMYAEPGRLPLGDYPNINAWYKRIEGLDGWKKSAPPTAK